ncbi:hypothetical protein EYW49_10535 [Siculibacillus lacustris]|uniref:GtrA family protein n=1 Tax=Siculibacillus lacustris TaxID=1549641 RepID=A0A4Q9VQG2_9HYPH|nr:hypothetical protein [Siculibacillus lacustris]TBW38032.1 hypothetical protein EYW49_10535 [Siculibacillus lacustris]
MSGGSDAAAPQAPTSALERFLKPHVAVIALAFALVLLRFVASWPTIGEVFHDTDDAMRLVEVRDFLAGQGWFDLHQYRLDPPAELPMHWSRFVDLPIAVLIGLFGVVFEPALAERAAMILWPPLTLIPVLLALRSLAGRFGGSFAALPAVYLAATCAPVIAQFVPGRIDHHNVQIALTLWLLDAVAAPPSPRRGLFAGLLIAAMTAVGMETLPFVLIVAAGFALRWVVIGDPDRIVGVWGATVAVAVPAIAAATLPVAEWTRPACDALSISYVAVATVGGLGLAIASRARLGLPGRLVALGVVAALALAAFAAPDPRCLAGPFAGITPQVRALWLDNVAEVQPWLTFTRAHPVDGLVAMLLPGLGLVAAALLARDPAIRTRLGFSVLVASALAALAIGLTQIRTMVYADALAVPLVAALIGLIGAEARGRGRSAVVAVLVGTILASSSLATVVIGRLAPASWSNTAGGPAILGGASATANDDEGAAARGPTCLTLAHYRALARLPVGLVAADIDLGPSILAATPHAVIAAPYHRMQRGIVDADRMINGDPATAFAALDARKVDYIVHCAAEGPATSTGGPKPGGLLARLLAGEGSTRIEEIPGDPAVRVFRLRPGSAFAGAATLTGR